MQNVDSAPQYNASGEFVCTNNGALFSHNASTSNETLCGVTAQWLRQDVVECYTGTLWFFLSYGHMGTHMILSVKQRANTENIVILLVLLLR